MPYFLKICVRFHQAFSEQQPIITDHRAILKVYKQYCVGYCSEYGHIFGFAM